MLGFAALKEGGAALVTLPIPEPAPYQALVRMRACGVCNGTDSKIVHHTFKLFDQYPTLLGHEGVGQVVRLGEKARRLRGAVEGRARGQRLLVRGVEKMELHRA